jgi:hypothetical protein
MRQRRGMARIDPLRMGIAAAAATRAINFRLNAPRGSASSMAKDVFQIVAVKFIHNDLGGRVKLGTACFNLGDFDGVCPRVWPTLAIRDRRVVFCLPVPGK